MNVKKFFRKGTIWLASTLAALGTLGLIATGITYGVQSSNAGKEGSSDATTATTAVLDGKTNSTYLLDVRASANASGQIVHDIVVQDENVTSLADAIAEQTRDTGWGWVNGKYVNSRAKSAGNTIGLTLVEDMEEISVAYDISGMQNIESTVTTEESKTEVKVYDTENVETNVETTIVSETENEDGTVTAIVETTTTTTTPYTIDEQTTISKTITEVDLGTQIDEIAALIAEKLGVDVETMAGYIRDGYLSEEKAYISTNTETTSVGTEVFYEETSETVTTEETNEKSQAQVQAEKISALSSELSEKYGKTYKIAVDDDGTAYVFEFFTDDGVECMKKYELTGSIDSFANAASVMSDMTINVATNGGASTSYSAQKFVDSGAMDESELSTYLSAVRSDAASVMFDRAAGGSTITLTFLDAEGNPLSVETHNVTCVKGFEGYTTNGVDNIFSAFKTVVKVELGQMTVGDNYAGMMNYNGITASVDFVEEPELEETATATTTAATASTQQTTNTNSNKWKGRNIVL